MSTAPSSSNSAPKSSSNVLRIVLFAVLGYMLIALAYDYLYVFKAHEEKTKATQELVEKETSRSAEDRQKNGPIGPKEVVALMGFAPTIVADDAYLHERYVYHRGVPIMVREIDVFYTGPKDARVLYSVANNAEDREIARPHHDDAPTPPPAAAEGDKKSAEGEKKSAEPAGDSPAPPVEEKKDEPAADKKDEPVEEKKAE